MKVLMYTIGMMLGIAGFSGCSITDAVLPDLETYEDAGILDIARPPQITHTGEEPLCAPNDKEGFCQIDCHILLPQSGRMAEPDYCNIQQRKSSIKMSMDGRRIAYENKTPIQRACLCVVNMNAIFQKQMNDGPDLAQVEIKLDVGYKFDYQYLSNAQSEMENIDQLNVFARKEMDKDGQQILFEYKSAAIPEVKMGFLSEAARALTGIEYGKYLFIMFFPNYKSRGCVPGSTGTGNCGMASDVHAKITNLSFVWNAVKVEMGK